MRTRTLIATAAATVMLAGTALTSYASVVATPTRPCAQPDGRVDAMAFSGGTLYIGGSFTHVKSRSGTSNVRGGLAAIDTATCDLTAWTSPTDGTVLDLVVSGSTVYAGGTFKHVGGLTRSRLAALDGTTAAVLPFAPVLDKQVNTLLVSGTTLYAGGKFAKVGTSARNRLAAFDLGTGALSATWKPNANGDVATLALGADGVDVYAGGSFTTLNGHPEYAYLGAVDAATGDSDNDFAPAPAYPILDLEVDARGVYAGGGGHGGHLDIYNLDGTQQQPTYQTDGNVQAVAVDGDSLWAGGHFTNYCVGGTGAGAPFICDQNLQRRKAFEVSLGTGQLTDWKPAFNSPFGLLVARVDPLTHALWTGGDFTTVNGVSVGHLARFDQAAPPPAPVRVVAGNGATSGGAANGTAASIPTTAPCGALPASSAPATWSHVTLIMFENKPLKKIVGNTADAPYLNSLINACSYAKNDQSLSTTSLANYIALTSGYTGCTAIDANFKCTQPKEITANKPSTTWPQATKSIFELMGSAAAEWNESAPTNCAAKGSGNYVDNHAPYHYYTRTQGSLCPQFDQPFPAAPADTMSAQFNLVIPNKVDIMHLVPGTTISQRIRNGDNWAKGFIPQLLSSPSYQSGDSAIIITWDEGNNSTFTVPLIVITPYTSVKGVSSVSYNHYSVLKGIQQMVGFDSPLLGHAGDAGVNSVRDDGAFGLKP